MSKTLEALKELMPGLKIKVTTNPELVKRQAEARKAMIKAQKENEENLKAQILAAETGPAGTDPRVLQMREIKATYNLRGNDIVALFAQQGFAITRTRLQSYLQGNVLGTDKRSWSAVGSKIEENHVDDVLVEFKKMEFRLKVDCKRFIGKDMRSIMESWYEDLGIIGASRERQLAQFVTSDPSTLFKWYKANRYPRSMYYLMEIQKVVDDIKIEEALREKYAEKVAQAKSYPKILAMKKPASKKSAVRLH